MVNEILPCGICGDAPKREFYTNRYTPRFYIYCPNHVQETIVMSTLSPNKAIDQWNQKVKEKANGREQGSR